MAKREKGHRKLDMEESMNVTMGDLFESAGIKLPEKPPSLPEEKPVGKRDRDVSPGSAPLHGKLVLRRERKGRKGKTVTLVEGLGEKKQRLEEMARDLRRDLGCGSHVEGDLVILQGDQTERAETWFRKKGFKSIVRGN